ncbi:MAG TPA: undecaprenyl-diphosphate phosphatase [Aminobacterium sp.]|jgi:undecaprenyl-diphosphatase|uniref:undecaprenyl-diphosphate phosphatase n=1 Tax=Aminobacterium TaxID=81466 RepID=UPI0004667905|nr:MULTISPECIES: undecaprenyl-diphosphate phosphatase [Aminobacterium]HCA40971.1 undecaprenyl-diphosphate phosphatase [Aminobacterium sp.]
MKAETLILGIVQGLAEFLPISSSGHLALLQNLWGIAEDSLTYDVLLHFSTMIATVVFFSRDIYSLAIEWFKGLFSPSGRETEGWRLGWAVICGTIVTGAIGFPLKPVVERWMVSPALIGCALLITSLLLWYASSLPQRSNKLSLLSGIVIGVAQGLAVIPGISRSGATIVTGLKRGLSPEEAFRFSFLLSLPAILGATLLQVMDLVRAGGFVDSLPDFWYGGIIAAFVTGYGALVWFRKMVTLGRWRIFALYCLVPAGISLVMSIWR